MQESGWPFRQFNRDPQNDPILKNVTIGKRCSTIKLRALKALEESKDDTALFKRIAQKSRKLTFKIY